MISAAFTKAFRAAGVGYTSSVSFELQMLAARAKKRRRIVKCLPTAQSLPLRQKIAACPALVTAAEIVQSFPPV